MTATHEPPAVNEDRTPPEVGNSAPAKQSPVVRASSLLKDPLPPVTDADFAGLHGQFGVIRARGELPHLHIEGGIYFVTFRMLDAVCFSSTGDVVLPLAHPVRQDDCTTLHHLEEARSDPMQIAAASEPPICAGSCALGKPEAARIVANALRHFDRLRYTLHAWCVMPNHVHVVVAPWAGHTLSSILHSWKSFTGTALNRLLKRHGAFWERESFDHLIRDLTSFEKFVDYVVQNPVAAGLIQEAEQWEFSSAFEEGLGKCTPERESPESV